MKYDVFISYSRKDIKIAKQICAVLDSYAQHYKFEYFFDQDDIISRDEYLKRISRAIFESKTMLFIASKNSYESEFCAKELLFADKQKVHIHQYRIDDAVVPLDIDMLLGTHQYREAKSTSIEGMVREVMADSLKCNIEPISQLEERRRREEEILREKQNSLEREKQAKLNKLKSRVLEIQEQIILSQQIITKLEREKLEIEQQISQLGKIFDTQPIVPIAPENRTSPTNAPTYKVGDHYNVNGLQGVVFEVSDNGRHGKIVGLKQERLQWSPAFQWCKRNGISWYLPSRDELSSLQKVKNKVNVTLRNIGGQPIQEAALYWTSTGVDASRAWLVDMGSNNYQVYNKLYPLYVRAVTTF